MRPPPNRLSWRWNVSEAPSTANRANPQETRSAHSYGHSAPGLGHGPVYEICVEAPEHCLRKAFRQTRSNAGRDTMLSNEAAYAYQQAIGCL